MIFTVMSYIFVRIVIQSWFCVESLSLRKLLKYCLHVIHADSILCRSPCQFVHTLYYSNKVIWLLGWMSNCYGFVFDTLRHPVTDLRQKEFSQTQTHTHAHTHAHRHTNTHKHKQTHTHTHACTQTHTSTCIHTSTQMHALTHAHIYTRTHTQTHKHAHTHVGIDTHIHTANTHKCSYTQHWRWALPLLSLMSAPSRYSVPHSLPTH